MKLYHGPFSETGLLNTLLFENSILKSDSYQVKEKSSIISNMKHKR